MTATRPTRPDEPSRGPDTQTGSSETSGSAADSAVLLPDGRAVSGSANTDEAIMAAGCVGSEPSTT